MHVSLKIHITPNILDYVIDVGQEINVGPGKFDKTNKRRAWIFLGILINVLRAIVPGKKSSL